jgi:hypothetical protein
MRGEIRSGSREDPALAELEHSTGPVLPALRQPASGQRFIRETQENIPFR